MPKRSNQGDAADEAQVFRAAVSDVTPLAHTLPPAGLRKKPSRRRAAPAAADPLQPGADLPLTAATVAADEPLAFRRPGVRDQVLRRLKRGQYPIEDELDLHGLDQASARGLLADFIAANRASGRRCVRIIHGKGHRSGARGPILKSAVNEWLRRNPDVVAFASARPIDGGTGALYALLHA